MADLLCVGREGSYGTNMCNLYIDDATLNNTTRFTSQIWGGGTSRDFIKPVGIYYIYNATIYMSVYGYNSGSNSVAKSENGGETKYYDTTGTGFSFGVEKTVTFQEVIPFFNNEADASNYSLGLEFDESNWVGGKPLTPPVVPITSNGGGATHIAKVTGQLKDLSSNLSDILIVSGGGGGGLLVGETEYTGKEAGGISGSGDNSADQSTGNAFGQGESGTNLSGGGSGLYGGYKGTSAKSGGAGSGYIGNFLLSNKKMVGYNVPTSSDEGTKTESVNDVSTNPVSGKPKSGNGHVRIKYLSDGIIRFKNAIVFPNDNYEVKGKNTENIYTIGQLKQTFSGNNTWFLIWETNGYIALQFNASSSWNMKLASGKYIVEGDEREDWLWGMNNVADPLYPCYLNGSYIGQSWSFEAKTIGNDTYRNDCYTGGTEEHPCIIVSTITGLEIYKDGVKAMVR